MASSSPSFSVVSFPSINTKLSVTRLNLLPLNPRHQYRRSNRNVISSSVSIPAVSPTSSSKRRPDELAASIFSKIASYIDKGRTLASRRNDCRNEDWDVVYCSNPTSPGGGFRSGLGRLVFKTNEMIQVVEAPDIVRNKVSFSALGFLDGEVSLKGKLIVLDEKWIQVVFEPQNLR